MSLIESNVRGESRSFHGFRNSRAINRRGDPVNVSIVIPRSGQDGRLDMSAAELAALESERTRQKLRIKADHLRKRVLFVRYMDSQDERTTSCLPQVARFHREVVQRLAKERQAADAGAGRARFCEAGPVYNHTSSEAGFGSNGPALEGEQQALWDLALPSLDETPYYTPVEAKGDRGNISSLFEADAEARATLAGYRSPWSSEEVE